MRQPGSKLCITCGCEWHAPAAAARRSTSPGLGVEAGPRVGAELSLANLLGYIGLVAGAVLILRVPLATLQEAW
jgi:hypothetical protein